MNIDHVLSGLKPIRTHLGVPSGELADRLGVTLSSYHRYENGTRRIYFDMAITLAQTLDCEVTDLIRWHSPEELTLKFGPARPARETRGRKKGTRVIAGTVMPPTYSMVQPEPVPPPPPPAPAAQTESVPPPPPISESDIVEQLGEEWEL